MSNDNNACIRYLMKEMDPSEEVLMERQMMEDDDLLIEVECMRQTLKRLDGLPEKEPPSQITDSILKKAREQKEKKQHATGLTAIQDLRYIAAAATILVAASLGGIWLFQDNGQGSETTDVSQAANLSNSFLFSKIAETSSKPWIDRNDVIYFQDRFNSKSDFDSILTNSTKKLKLIEDPLLNDQNNHSLQLTGTGN